MWGERGWSFLFVGGVSCIPLFSCSIPSPPWLPAAFLLFHALAVLLLAAALGGLVLHTWWCCLCWRSGALCRGVWLPPCLCARAFSPCFRLPSSSVTLFCFFAGSLIACMYLVALHTLLCLWRLVCVSMGIPFAPYADVRGWACSLGYTFLFTCVGAVIVVLLSLLWLGVACNILLLVLAHRCPWWRWVALLAAACMRIYGRHTFCSLCKRACGGGRVLSATPLGYLCWRGYQSLRAHLDQILHTVVLPGLTRLHSEGARLNR